MKATNLDELLLKWINSYLLNHQQCVVVSGSTSSLLHVTSGVPQGSVLGPLRFLFYINTVSSLPFFASTRIVLYADDILLFKPISFQDDYRDLQQDINLLADYVHHCHLAFSPTKCKVLLATKRKSHLLPATPLTLNHVILEVVETYCYLGVIINSKLTWADHIRSVVAKSRRLVGQTYREFYAWTDPILVPP